MSRCGRCSERPQAQVRPNVIRLEHPAKSRLHQFRLTPPQTKALKLLELTTSRSKRRTPSPLTHPPTPPGEQRWQWLRREMRVAAAGELVWLSKPRQLDLGSSLGRTSVMDAVGLRVQSRTRFVRASTRPHLHALASSVLPIFLNTATDLLVI